MPSSNPQSEIRNPQWVSRWTLAAAAMTFVVLLFGTDLFARRSVLPILWWLENLFGWKGLFRPSGEMGTEEGVLRKTAHVLEYALLALAWLQAFHYRFPAWPRWRQVAGSFVVCVVVAVIDELQQGLVATGRTGSGRDVLIDAAGAAMALLLAGFFVSSSTLQSPRSTLAT